MTIALAAALAAVRGWTRVYTAGMDRPLRERRRAEIESDLWELHEDARRRGAPPSLIALHMLLRLLSGIADDVGWRIDSIRLSTTALTGALWVSAAAAVAFVWWLSFTLEAVAPRDAAGGINVVRLLYPVRPIATLPPLPVSPMASAPKVTGYAMRASTNTPPPPPPPPER